MLYKYETPNFKTLQATLYEFLNEKSNDTSISIEKRKLSGLLSDAIDLVHIDRLYKLDRLNLTYNSWSDINKSINNNLLASYNVLLYRITHGEKIENLPLDSIIESLYLVLYADFYEASLIAPDINDKNFFENKITNFNYYAEYLSPESLNGLRFLWFEIPKNVFTIHLNQHLDSKVLENVEKLQTNDTFIEDKQIASESLKKDIENIEKSLEAQKSEYNFLGLSNGFRALRKAKADDLTAEKTTYRNLTIAVILLVFIKTIGSLIYLSSSSSISSVFIAVTITTIFFLFILLYFFRISLVNIKSIKSQILQIDLRLTLCQFIHNYETDTAKLRSKDMKESFDKFESVIFAPIVATEDQMPSTFDGLEQITNLLGSITNKGK